MSFLVKFTSRYTHPEKGVQYIKEDTAISESDYNEFKLGNKEPATKEVQRIIEYFNSTLREWEQERELHSIDDVCLVPIGYYYEDDDNDED